MEYSEDIWRPWFNARLVYYIKVYERELNGNQPVALSSLLFTPAVYMACNVTRPREIDIDSDR